MVGRDVLLRVAKTAARPAEPLLQVEGLRVIDDRGIEKVRGVSFEVRAGEIVALAGIDGNGQTELIDGMTGLQAVEAGSVRVDGNDVTRESAHGHLQAGLGHIPEDHSARQGSCSSTRLAENMALTTIARAGPRAWAGSSGAKAGRERSRADSDFDVRGTAPASLRAGFRAATSRRSCGAREIDARSEGAIAAQPTRGLDVGAIEFVHRRLVEERDEGRAILLVSLELEEVLSLWIASSSCTRASSRASSRRRDPRRRSASR